MNIYRHTFYARCPVDGALILYGLTIRANARIMAEAIVEACASHKEGLHEDIADDLHARLGGEHTLTARHPGNVEIETVRA